MKRDWKIRLPGLVEVIPVLLQSFKLVFCKGRWGGGGGGRHLESAEGKGLTGRSGVSGGFEMLLPALDMRYVFEK